MTEYKRQYRELSDETKRKLSQSARGRKKPEWVKNLIRQGMLAYWDTVPHRPENNDDNSDEQW